MYMTTLLHCHFCIQIITDHFLLIKVSHPIHTIPGINAHLLYHILCSWKYSIKQKLLYCPVCIFGCFHGNEICVASWHYFYTWGILQEVDIISTVRPHAVQIFVTLYHTLQQKLWFLPYKLFRYFSRYLYLLLHLNNPLVQYWITNLQMIICQY